MIGDIPVFMDPFNWGTTFSSKDYSLHELKSGENCFDFFGLKQPAVKVMMHNPHMVTPVGRYESVDKTGDKPAQTDITTTDIQSAITLCEIERLHSQPESYVDREVFKRWIINGTDHGVCKGRVKSFDTSQCGPSDRPWMICRAVARPRRRSPARATSEPRA